jgi:DeoR/GlpR family transcriptional regulator of sugar metabolism
LEQIIASSCRQKILLALSKTKTTHVTNLVRITNSTYNQISRNLQILEKEGIIKIRCYGHLKMIELEKGNLKTQTLLKALHMLDTHIPNSQEAISSNHHTQVYDS